MLFSFMYILRGYGSFWIFSHDVFTETFTPLWHRIIVGYNVFDIHKQAICF